MSIRPTTSAVTSAARVYNNKRNTKKVLKFVRILPQKPNNKINPVIGIIARRITDLPITGTKYQIKKQYRMKINIPTKALLPWPSSGILNLIREVLSLSACSAVILDIQFTERIHQY